MSRITSQLMNAVPRLVLASPAHALMSKRYATLHFRGRRSGRRYHVPVAYLAREDGALLVSTDSAWWWNIANREPFKVTLRGARLPVTATRAEGDLAIEALAGLVQLPGYAKAAGVPRQPDGTVKPADLVRAADERVVLALKLGER